MIGSAEVEPLEVECHSFELFAFSEDFCYNFIYLSDKDTLHVMKSNNACHTMIIPWYVNVTVPA